ncbi:MAG TPA: hypothetical protein VIM79_23630, partial [Niastella sp.]
MLLILALESCARVNNKKVTSAPVNEGDTASLPARAATLSPEEINNYRRRVSNHLDSTLGKTR